MNEVIELFIIVSVFAAAYAAMLMTNHRLTKRKMTMIVIPLMAMLLFVSCGGNPEDHTGENWLLLLGLILCWLKG